MNYQLPPEAEQIRDRVCNCHKQSEQRQKSHRRTWNRLYSLVRNHSEFRRHYQQVGEPDRDVALKDLRRQVGGELFIPYTFEAVMTILPRQVSHRPKMIIAPRGDTPEENVQAMSTIVDGQQEQINYEMVLQETALSGLLYGLGVEKHYWRCDTYEQKVLERGVKNDWVEGVERRGHDDPDCENVDIFDFFPDPMGDSMDRCRWAIHRVWRDTGYVKKALITGRWNNPFGFPPSEVADCGPSSQEYETTHKERMAAAGHEDWDSRDNQLHEVWEFHDGKQVIVILNRKWPLHVAEFPYWHAKLPFVAGRPAPSGIKQLCGIGVVEPMEHLQYEMNTLRTQRRDNASFAVNRSFFYQDGLVDPDDFKAGPGMAVPVNGDPRELLFPWPIQDVPQSGYQEEANLMADIQRVTGVSDSVTGASDAGATATGVQLVQSAANVRIAFGARRLEAEVIAPAGRLWVAMNQQMIRENRTIAIPAPPQPGGPERKWAQREIGPAELAGEMSIAVEGGSTAPENPAEQIQKAQIGMQLFRGLPEVDQRQLLAWTLRNMGVKQPESWLAPEGPKVPFLLMAMEQVAGLSQGQIEMLVQAAEQLEHQEADGAQGAQPPGLDRQAA